jgi:xanthine/CO dehydrogenase XdhC/CoxF family maturation factor
MNLSETAEVLSAVEALRADGRKMALATIVGVRGSTYRRPGARFLVPDAGEPVGNLSGGCLEGEVEQIARDVMTSGVARLELYDLTADDEVVWGWGLGCNGAIEVFIEPADRVAEVASALRTAIQKERPICLATVVESRLDGVSRGARLIAHPDERVEGTLGVGEADAAVAQAAAGALAGGRAETVRLEVGSGELRVFIESLMPPPQLLVCGAGHDAIPLVRVASELGWKVVVVDDRSDFLDEKRFPGAARFVHTNPEDAATAAGVDRRTYVVVVSHNYLRDRSYLQSFLGTGVAYIGMLGPRARLQRLIGDLEREGVTPGPGDVPKLHGPAGLDLGAEGPEEIATAIVAEVLAVSRGRAGGFLRHRDAPIHARPPSDAEAAGRTQ